MNVEPKNNQVDRIFSQYTAPGSPGCSVAVMKNGEIVYKQGFGLENLEQRIPFLPSTVFNIGSTAKQFTGFGIAFLEEKGQLTIQEDIHRYLPEMPDFGVSITIENLLYHTSGIRCTFPDLLGLAEWRESDVVTQDDVFGLLQKQRELDFPSGTEFSYANSNYILLALICERVSGQPFAEFCEREIFTPMGMDHSLILDDPWKIIPDKASSYYEDGAGNWSNALLVNGVQGPTNVYTTVEDLALWDENFYSGEIGGSQVIERMEQPGKLADGKVLDYAFGLEVGPNHTHRGWQMIEHGSGHGGYCNHMLRFPELHFSVVVFFNSFLWNSRDYALKVADLYIESNSEDYSRESSPTYEPVEFASNKNQLEVKAGKYFNADRAALRTVDFKEGVLNYEALDLVPLSEQRFYFREVPDVEVEFASDEAGKPIGLTTFTSSGEYAYDFVDSDQPAGEEMSSYAGRYYSPELDLYWLVSLNEGNLVIQRRKYADSQLSPLDRDVFSDDWSGIVGYPSLYTIIFERDQQGEIDSLKVSGSRIRNLKFEKCQDG